MWAQQAETNLVKYLMNDHKSIIYSSQLFGTTRPCMYVHLLTILLANDVALNPGPVAKTLQIKVYPTNVGHTKACKLEQQSVTLATNGIMSLASLYHQHFNYSDAALDCIICGCLNFSTFCFT